MSITWLCPALHTGGSAWVRDEGKGVQGWTPAHHIPTLSLQPGAAAHQTALLPVEQVSLIFANFV